MSARRRNVLLVVTAVLLALGLFVLLGGGTWLAKRQLAAAVERATGLPCSIGELRLSAGGAEVSDLRLGRAPGPVIEIDRLNAVGRLVGAKLSRLAVNRGTVRVRLPNWPCVTLTGVDLEAGNLEALTSRSGTIRVAGRGNCTELNSLLAGAGAKARFLRGRFTVWGEVAATRREQDIPLAVRLENFQVKSLDGRFQGEAAEAEAPLHLIVGKDGRMSLDARELAPLIGGEDISKYLKK